ncbi:hypothetical protein QCA50_013408 [Cerrena zonata]|uniref:Uncharacterized protein n=1 Tax=Cerrena zonata TaxID=2478898 RepID=A0AAW0FXF3_9APHY
MAILCLLTSKHKLATYSRWIPTLPRQTVREALLFSAKLRQPTSVPLAEKEAYVEKCLKMCGLEAYADAVVGSLGVEFRKRTTIGVELAAKPRLLLFLDEPTSGLDSQSAWAIMSFLRSLADSGQAILCTIHQPSSELFETTTGHVVATHKRTLRNTSLLLQEPAQPAHSDTDWHEVWKQSTEAQKVQAAIDTIHAEGRAKPPPQALHHSEFATSWSYQLATLVKREAQDHWRNPSFLIAKMALNIGAGLLIGFTFFKSKNTIQGTQNKLFAIFIGLLPGVPLGQQLTVPFIETRTVYEIRERPSRMYSWTALLTAQLIVETPWNIIGSTLFFLCWYWTVGFPTDRGGYTYLLYGILTPIYYTTLGQAVAAMSPNVEIAALLFAFFFAFVMIFCGVLQPYQLLSWWRWMYRVSPYTYLVEGLLGQAVGKREIVCSPVEFAIVSPPSGQTCKAFLEPFITFAGGYLNNPEATANCQYCAFRNADQFLLQGFNIQYAHRWRNIGLFMVFTVFNVAAIFSLTYVFRIEGSSILLWMKTHIFRRK